MTIIDFYRRRRCFRRIGHARRMLTTNVKMVKIASVTGYVPIYTASTENL